MPHSFKAFLGLSLRIGFPHPEDSMDTIHAASVMDSHPDLSPFLARQSPAVILQFGYGSLIFRQRCTYAVVVGVCVPLPRPLGGRPVLELDYHAVPSIGLERYIPNGV